MTASEVRRLALPAIAHSLLQTLVFVVDRIMLGRHGEASLAAMQIGSNLEWSIWSIFAAFEIGTIARIGRHVGAGDTGGARRAAWISLGLAAGIGTALALSTPLVLFAIGRIFTSVSAPAMAEARAYLGMTLGASPIVFLSMTAIATLQAGGDTKTPLVIGIFANALHILMNRILILGLFGIPGLGARGAGISTAVTFALQAGLAILALSSTRRMVSLRARPTDRAPPPGETKRLLAVALPSFLERFLYHLGFAGYVVIIARLGDDTMAANQSLISVESICFLSGDGFGIAAAALVAQRLGAGDPKGARRAATFATRDAVILLTFFGIASYALKDAILPVFSHDPTVLAIGRASMPVVAIAQPFMAMGIVLAQSLRGAGRTREALGVSVISALFVRLGFTWLFAITLDFGLPGVWIGSTVDWIVRSALYAFLARRISGTDARGSPT